MATNLELSPELVEEALSLSEQKTKRALVEEALTEYVQRRKQRKLAALFGTIAYDENYDYKTQRSIP